MIPGPVSGHVPVDPGAAQRPMTEPAGESSAEAGTSFADLLAAMLAPGAPGPQLQPAAGEEAVFERLDAAEMFNETGLFRGAAPLPAQRAMLADPAIAESVAEAPPAMPGPRSEAGIEALAPGIEPGEAPVVLAAAGVVGGGGAAVVAGSNGAIPTATHGGIPSIHAHAAAAATGPVQNVAAAPERAGGGRVSARTAAMVAQLMAARNGAAAAQVSVQAAEGGISVMARVDRLSREERDRLRGEIGELLARHGFANAEIVLNGEAWPLPQREED